ncbi:CatB-related O-acetyltransferase [Paenibacillus sp. SI8]|uniref:CatB-related O-acetyltransferase n=1 Tax=unclassified Paenibacillus TaxID=185978 RepID=UPI0034677471
MEILKHIEWLNGCDLDPKKFYIDLKNNVLVEYPYGNGNGTASLLNFAMGRNSYFQSGVISPNVIIGRYCSISHNVHLGASQHPMDYLSTGILNMDFDIKGMVSQTDYTVIGSDVWIGLNVVVMNGVKIGHGAVIGAGAIVTKDIPPYAVVGGVPAKIIKYRFEQDVIDELLESKWWEFDPVEIEYLPKQNIKACIEYFKVKRAAEKLK